LGILYLIDRSVTQILQYFSRKIKDLVKIGPWFQSKVVFITLAVVILLELDLPNASLLGLLFATVIYLFNYQWEFTVAGLLVNIHDFFDEDWVYSERLYEPGHLAWAAVLIGFSYTTLGYRLGYDELQVAFTINGVFMFSHGLWHFMIRRKGSNTEKKEGVSEALQKLIERCRHWLPKTVPALG